MAEQTFTVMLCCNDPRNGSFTWRVHNVEIDDEFRLEAVPENGFSLGIAPDGIRVFRRRFKAQGHARWVGNWCWDAVQMELQEARRLVRYLLELGSSVDEYSMEGPFADLFKEEQARHA